MQVIYNGLLSSVVGIFDGGTVSSDGTWAPSPRIAMLGGVLPLLTRSVQFRFVATAGTAQIDDGAAPDGSAHVKLIANYQEAEAGAGSRLRPGQLRRRRAQGRPRRLRSRLRPAHPRAAAHRADAAT